MTERKGDRRKIERRAPKRAVTIRYEDDTEKPPQRVRMGQFLREQRLKS